MNDFSKILSKAKELESKMKESQKKIKNISATGISGGNAIKITLNGDGELISIDISCDVSMKMFLGFSSSIMFVI